MWESRMRFPSLALPFRTVNRHQMIVPVSINHAGPFSFLLDTGTQMTMVEPALAAALHLETTGNAEVAMLTRGPPIGRRKSLPHGR
jgi:hypothetical protein